MNGSAQTAQPSPQSRRWPLLSIVAATGLVAIELLLGYVRRHDYSPFVLYRLAVAVVIVAVIASGARSATF